MGSNKVELVKGYLKLAEELKEAKDSHSAEIIKAKMEGIIFGYETYVSQHWATFNSLIDEYYHYIK